MDERFEGWDCEDTEFLRRISWPRLPGPLFHIWHAKGYAKGELLFLGASGSKRGKERWAITYKFVASGAACRRPGLEAASLEQAGGDR